MAGRIWYKDSSGDAERRQRETKRSLLGGKNVTSTGLEDIFYKCQISHPVQSDFHVGVPPTQSHSASPSPPSSLAPLSSGGGDPELSLRRRSTSDKKGRRSRRLSFIDDSCQDVLFFFFSLEVTNRKRNVHEAAMNNAPRASVQSLSCLHSPCRD